MLPCLEDELDIDSAFMFLVSSCPHFKKKAWNLDVYDCTLRTDLLIYKGSTAIHLYLAIPDKNRLTAFERSRTLNMTFTLQ